MEYKMLKNGQKLKTNDEVQDITGQWRPTAFAGFVIGISPHTVGKYRRPIRLKLGSKTKIKKSEYAFAFHFNKMAEIVGDIAISKGWWKKNRNEGELIALMHSELSEALEALRHGNKKSEHIPGFTGIEEEFADVIIRIMDHARAKGYRVAEALIKKVEFNRGREHMHGGKKF